MASRTPKAAHLSTPNYGLEKAKLLPWKWARERLEKSHNYYISTASPSGRPHLMVIWGLWLDGRFYFSTGSTSRKARNLAANPRCVIATDKSPEAVIIEGTAALKQDRRLRGRFARIYEKKYKWDMKDFDEPMYELTPARAFGLYEKDFQGTATKWEF
jgi:hypothetical protein